MMRRLTAVVAGAGVLLTASVAGAQAHGGFGQQSGEFIFSADRLFSLFSYTHVSQDRLNPVPAGTKFVDTSNGTSISLLGGISLPIGTNDGQVIVSPFTVPRLGFDYVVIPRVTVGGDVIVFFTLGGNTATDATPNGGSTTTNSNDVPSQLLFGVAPRAGYIFTLTDLFSIWLRGGLSYYLETTKQTIGAGNAQVTTSFNTNQFALDLEPQLVITPVPHVGFTLSPTLDIPLVGRHSTTQDRTNGSTSTDASSSILFFGITAGLLAYF
jgi:hypothetical protein